MATIVSRKRKDGTMAHRAQIVIKKKGKVIHRESETFDKKKDAQAWAKKRETTLSEKGVPTVRHDETTLEDLLKEYEKKIQKVKPYGRSKEQVISMWKADYGSTPLSEIDTSWVIDYAMERIGSGVKPATVHTHLSPLRSAFGIAKDVLKIDASLTPFIDAQPTLKKLGLVGKSNERSRRAGVQEISDIVAMSYETRTSRRGKREGYTPIDKLTVFAMFSGRRASEICRIRWEDLDKDKRTVLVRDMKDPQNKKGNHIKVLIPEEAFAIIETMPEDDERIFPFNSHSVTTVYDRHRAKAGHFYGEEESLRFHDLRHECFSWLAEKNGLAGENWDIPRLKLVSGHKDWNVLQRYVNLVDAEPVDKWKDWEWKTKVLD